MVCGVVAGAGERVSGTWGVKKINGHMTYADVWTNEKIKTKFTQNGPRRGRSETVAAGRSTRGPVNGRGGNRRSKRNHKCIRGCPGSVLFNTDGLSHNQHKAVNDVGSTTDM